MNISKSEYEHYTALKKLELKGQLLTPEALALICRANSFNAEQIGREILSVYARQQNVKIKRF